MEYGVLSVILVIVVAFLAGLEGILDQWQFHQPIIACSLIGIVTGHASAGIILGGSLQLIALGWANVGAAVAPDAALASVASSILMVQSNNFDLTHIMGTIVPAAILLATAGLVLTTLVRMLSVVLVHQADRAAENGSYSGVEMWHFIALICQGLRIAIPAGLLLVISPDAIQKALAAIPPVISGGLAVGGGMVVAVGYAMVINLMATREVWPFFFLGFALAALKELTLISLGIIGLCLAVMYLALEASGSNGSSNDGGSGDPLGEILEDF